MKKKLFHFSLFASLTFCALCAQDKYIFSADGVVVGSKPRELPSQGYDRVTGRVVVGLHMRTDAERAACGWWRIVSTPKPGIVVSNEYWAVTGYTFTNSVAYQAWGRKWRKVVPRRFSKMLIVAALTREGAWPQVKAWIEAQGLTDLYLAAQDFAEDNAYFTQGKAAIQAALGWTDAQVEALLKEAEIKGAGR